MHSFNSWITFIGLIKVHLLFSQTISVQDTLRLQKNKNRYNLTNNYIPPVSIQITINGKLTKADSIDHINGIVFFKRMSRLKAERIKNKIAKKGHSST